MDESLPTTTEQVTREQKDLMLRGALNMGTAATALARATGERLLEKFAQKYCVRVRRDSLNEPIIPGKQLCKDMPRRTEYRSHIYEHGQDGLFGVCLMFSPSSGTQSKTGRSQSWATARKQLRAAGFHIAQDGDAEGSALFDPRNETQAKLAMKLVGIRPRRQVSPEVLKRLAMFRLNREAPAQEGPALA